ncbi:NHL repeat-containing protein [Nocardia sp. NBC_00881]|uniref:NHL repeat-containing protein n=1 Tax=Nocardia sp. NBC_00881 TaxID=2975995 RepID=UPI003863C9B2|nr:NHL repeat-containing protein [Nocardia sp. NBC_00881]
MKNATTPVRTIVTVAGTGAAGFSGDGGQAVSARLYYPAGVAVDASGNIYFADTYNHMVRRVDSQGVITTVAGAAPSPGFDGNGGPATAARLNYPAGVAVDASGNIYIADTNNHMVRRVDSQGVITTVAGAAPIAGFGGDGGPATAAAARLYSPAGVAVDASGNIYIADTSNHRVRRVDSQGVITTVAGNGSTEFAGDMGPASATTLKYPMGVAVDSSGNVYIADTDNQRVRQVDSLGIIATVAGNGTAGYFGEGGPATATTLNKPRGVAVDFSGNLYIAEHGNHRVRQVDSLGIITTVAGNGTDASSAGDGPATFASLQSPTGVAVHPSGSIVITDFAGHRIRRIAH